MAESVSSGSPGSSPVVANATNTATKEQAAKEKKGKEKAGKEKEKEKEKGDNDNKRRRSSGVLDQLSTIIKAPYVTETAAWPTANAAVQEAVNYAVQEQNRLIMNNLDDVKRILAAR